MSARATVRTATVLLLTGIGMVNAATDMLLPWHPFADYGFSATNRGYVTAVRPAAAAAGLRLGDRIDVGRLTPAGRMLVSYLATAPPGSRLQLPLVSGRTVTVTSVVRTRSLADNLSDWLSNVAVLLYAFIAALLVLLRPSPATWAFYVFSLTSFSGGTLISEFAPFPLLFGLSLYYAASAAASVAALVSFALRFPGVKLGAAAAAIERVALFALAPIFTACVVGKFALYVLAGAVAPNWFAAAIVAWFFGGTAFGVIVLIARYSTAERSVRNQLQWVVIAFAVAFLPRLAIRFTETNLGLFPPLWVVNVADAWTVLAPLAVAYTVLRHRLFDIRFVVSRALIYASITALAGGTLASLDWAFGRWLSEWRFALAAELALTLAIGAVFGSVHRRVERALNAVIFRSQTLALDALRRFAQEVDLIADPQRLIAQTFEALQARLESDYVAIYTAEGASYVLAAPHGGAAPALLPSDDFAVLRLRRWSETFACDEPAHPLRDALLVPMSARGHLIGFVACGPKRDRTHYLPAEIETLAGLAHRVGNAYAWLTFRGGATAEETLLLGSERERSASD